MKKILISLLALLLVFNTIGCGKNTITENSSKNKLTYYSKLDNFKCLELNENVKETSNNYFIDKDGNLYEYSFIKLFSNTNTNCAKVDTKGKYISGFSGSFAYDNNDYAYALVDINNNKDVFLNIKGHEYEKSREYFIKKNFPNSSLQLFLITNFGIIVENNKLYIVQFDLDDENKIKEEIKFDNSEEIRNIYSLSHSNRNFFVETSNSYFMCSKEIINNQDCKAYADIECSEEFVCNKINDFNKSDVKKFIGEIVILNDGSIYKYSTLLID